MTTKILVPRASGEGGMGVVDNVWGEAYYDTGNFNKGLFVSGHNITEIIAETVTQGGLGGEWNAGAGGIIYYNGGNVGIGTTSTLSKLEINGTATINPTLTAGNNGGLWFGKNSTAQGYIGGGDFAVNGLNDDDFGISSALDGDLAFGTTTSSGGTDHERVRITSIGKVGIGTSIPTEVLHVHGNTRIDGNLRFDPLTDTPYLIGGQVSTEFRNNANNTSLVTILDDGKVGILTRASDTEDPRYPLESFGAASNSITITSDHLEQWLRQNWGV